jgi:hypothetical protein
VAEARLVAGGGMGIPFSVAAGGPWLVRKARHPLGCAIRSCVMFVPTQARAKRRRLWPKGRLLRCLGRTGGECAT